MYVLSAHSKWSAPAIAVLKSIEAGEATGIVSSLCLTEVLAGYGFQTEASEDAQLFMEGLQGIDYCPVDTETAIRAGHLRSQFGSKLRTPDALHLATAIIQSADVFMTNDNYLVGLEIPGLKIRRLGEADNTSS